MKRSTSVLLIVRLCLVVAVAVFLLGAGGGLQAADEVVRIGNIIPLSGPSASVGEQGRNAREMAVEEINAAGGIKSLGG
ncbi:MAG: ABC transporter substrate-binding protein, partial [Desulfobacterales bacterium]